VYDCTNGRYRLRIVACHRGSLRDCACLTPQVEWMPSHHLITLVVNIPELIMDFAIVVGDVRLKVGPRWAPVQVTQLIECIVSIALVIVQIVISLPSQTLLGVGVGLRPLEILEIVVRQSLRLALSANTNDLRNTDINKMLQKLIQSMICVAPIKLSDHS
jgi:hypothetical protein